MKKENHAKSHASPYRLEDQNCIIVGEANPPYAVREPRPKTYLRRVEIQDLIARADK